MSQGGRMNLLDIANRALAEFEAKANAPVPDPDRTTAPALVDSLPRPRAGRSDLRARHQAQDGPARVPEGGLGGADHRPVERNVIIPLRFPHDRDRPPAPARARCRWPLTVSRNRRYLASYVTDTPLRRGSGRSVASIQWARSARSSHTANSLRAAIRLRYRTHKVDQA